MPRSLLVRTVLPVIVALALAAVFARLGFWQLGRLHERRELNAIVVERLSGPAGPIGPLSRDPSFARFRRVQLNGHYDYENELILAGRSRNGSPGVHILTPLRLSSDTAVLVNRGWVYSPDGASADLARWREPDSVEVRGFVEPLGSTAGSTGTGPSARSRIIRSLAFKVVSERIPYPVLPLLVVQEDTVAAATDRRLRDLGADSTRPVRLSVPALDEGPHKSYAMQWFFFASMALAAAGLLVRLEMTRRGNKVLAERETAS